MIGAKALLLASLLGFGGASITMLTVRQPAPLPAARSPRAVVLPEVVVSVTVDDTGRVVTIPAIQIVGDAHPAGMSSGESDPGG